MSTARTSPAAGESKDGESATTAHIDRGDVAPAASPAPAPSKQRSGQDPRRFTVRVLSDWRELESLKPEWEDLAENAIELAPCAEAWMLLPALRHGLPGDTVRVVLVFGSDEKSQEGRARLCGVFAVEERARYRGLPSRVIRLWNHLYSIFPAPLLRRDCAHESLRAFLDWVATTQPAHSLIQFLELRADSAFFRVLTETVRHAGLTNLIVGAYARAFFRPKSDTERYLQSIGTPHHRHEWKRQERRLSEKGNLTYASYDPSQDAQQWLDEFIELEASGWKGKAGSAFRCNPAHRAWLEEIVRSLADRGRLMMLALRLDGKPVAIRINILAPPGSYAFKIAYDERLSKFSPGVLLELENIRRLHGLPGIEWMDSVAAPDHPLMDRVWSDRTAIVSLLIAPGPFLGKLFLAAIPLLRLLRRIAVDTPPDNR